MSISDLTGTSWVFNDNLVTSQGGTYWFRDVLFSVNGTTAETGFMITSNNGTVSAMLYINPSGTMLQAFSGGQWLIPQCKKITITGGSMTTNTDLINFIEANATQVKYINKIKYDSSTLIDLTSDTINASALLQGYTAHDATGAKIAGQMEEPVAMTSAEILAAVQAGWQ